MTTGRAAEGLGWIVRLKETARLGGLGRWTQLSDEAQRLQLENALGRYAEVLAAVEPLRAEMATLPVESAAAEAANAWNVQEGILDTGAYAALNLGRWETALALNAEILDVLQARGASTLEIARKRFNNYFPLDSPRAVQRSGGDVGRMPTGL